MKQSFESSISCKKITLVLQNKAARACIERYMLFKNKRQPKKTTDNVRRLARIFHFERLLMTDNFGNFLSCIHLFSFYLHFTYLHSCKVCLKRSDCIWYR